MANCPCGNACKCGADCKCGESCKCTNCAATTCTKCVN